MKYYGRLSVAALLAIAPLYGFAQEKVVAIKYGDMDQWIIRKDVYKRQPFNSPSISLSIS